MCLACCGRAKPLDETRAFSNDVGTSVRSIDNSLYTQNHDLAVGGAATDEMSTYALRTKVHVRSQTKLKKHLEKKLHNASKPATR